MQPAILITPDEVRSWDPCYSDDRIAALFGDRAALTPREIGALNIPARDRVWALCRVMAFRAPGTIDPFTEWCDERADGYKDDEYEYDDAADYADTVACRASGCAGHRASRDADRANWTAAWFAAANAECNLQIAKALELIEGCKENP